MKEISDGLISLSHAIGSTADAITHFNDALQKVNRYFTYLAFVRKIENVRFWKSITLGLTYSEKLYNVPSYEEFVQNNLVKELKVQFQNG